MSYAPNSDYALEVAAGNIDGKYAVNKFGALDPVTADTLIDIWDGDGTYSFPATALMSHINQQADQVALRGATVLVQGLDANWDLVTQFPTLDASDSSTPVALATPLIRCFRMILMGVVISDSNIRVHNAGDTIDYAIIGAGIHQTLMAIYTVPADFTAYMTSYYASVIVTTNKNPTSTEIFVQAADNAMGHLFTYKHANAIPQAQVGFQHEFNPYYKFTEKTDIKVSAVCADEDGHVHAGFDLILVAN